MDTEREEEEEEEERGVCKNMLFIKFGNSYLRCQRIITSCKNQRSRFTIKHLPRREFVVKDKMTTSELHPHFVPSNPPPGGGMLNEFIAGGVAGCISIVAGQPFDTMKARNSHFFQNRFPP
jgi:hypothetical protein